MNSLTYTNIESAKNEFLDWIKVDKNNFGENDYETVIAKVMEAAKVLKVVDMTLNYHYFMWGFSFSYGECADLENYVPISNADSVVLRWQARNENCGPRWPIKDLNTNTFFLPKITLNEIVPDNRLTTTEEYLRRVIRTALENQTCTEYKILKALTPYAKQIKETFGPNRYSKIRQIVSEFPE